MRSDSVFRPVDAVAKHLPFHIDDTDKVNAAFTRWRTHGDREARRIADLWTYCFIRRYFTTKYLQNSIENVAELDALVAKAYRKIAEYRPKIDDCGRYASWVSVVCKNTFLNFLRTQRTFISVDKQELKGSGVFLKTPPPSIDPDAARLSDTLQDAIRSLPTFLQQTAFLYFVEGYTYQEVSDMTGKSLPTVRAYVNKAVHSFRDDPKLVALLERRRRVDS